MHTDIYERKIAYCCQLHPASVLPTLENKDLQKGMGMCGQKITVLLEEIQMYPCTITFSLPRGKHESSNQKQFSKTINFRLYINRYSWQHCPPLLFFHGTFCCCKTLCLEDAKLSQLWRLEVNSIPFYTEDRQWFPKVGNSQEKSQGFATCISLPKACFI